MDGNFTIAAPGTDDAEFTDFVGLKRRYSIGRSAAYTHIENGDFRSVVLRKPGRIKGKRLIFIPSVREWIAKQLAEQESGEVEKIDPRLSAQCKKANRKMQESQKEKRENEKRKGKINAKDL
jgi:RNase H-fold protein (predicted Holliday junction resolvase)